MASGQANGLRGSTGFFGVVCFLLSSISFHNLSSRSNSFESPDSCALNRAERIMGTSSVTSKFPVSGLLDARREVRYYNCQLVGLKQAIPHTLAGIRQAVAKAGAR